MALWKSLAGLLALVLLLGGCSRPPTAGEPAAPDLAVDPDGGDEPAEDVPPATAPHAAGALAATAPDLAAGLPAPLGADAQALRDGWGRPLEGGPDAADAAACHYLFTDPGRAEGFGQAFMLEGGRFVRMDVDDAALAAPGGGRVGMDAAAVAALYPGRVEQQPHKYVEGARILRVTGDGEAVLVFATDAAGVVRSWRVGLPPQVDYVEGCG